MLGRARMFRIMDDNDSKTLDMNEFKKAMRDLALMLTELEVRQLFQLFDRDGSGTISYDEFMAVLRVRLFVFHLPLSFLYDSFCPHSYLFFLIFQSLICSLLLPTLYVIGSYESSS